MTITLAMLPVGGSSPLCARSWDLISKKRTDSHAEPCQIVTRDGNSSMRASALETDLLEFIILKFCVCCAARALKTPTGDDLRTHAPNICSSRSCNLRGPLGGGLAVYVITNISCLIHQRFWNI
jgi:hypothetical protein